MKAAPALLIASFGYYVALMACYAFDAAEVGTKVWTTALIVALIVGLILNANALKGDVGILEHVKENRMMTIKFFIIPFCVSSISSVCNIIGDTHFVLVFPTSPIEKVIPVYAAPFVVAGLFYLFTAMPCKCKKEEQGRPSTETSLMENNNA